MLAGGIALALFGCGGGSGGGQPAPADARPSAVIRASALAVTNQGGAAVDTVVGGSVALDASDSTAGSGTIVRYDWAVTSRPAASRAQPVPSSVARPTFTPDVAGSYELTLTIIDSAGATATAKVSVDVGAAPPVPTVVTAVVFNGPTQTLPERAVAVGASVLLDASASTAPDGSALALSFTMLDKPAGSSATLGVVGTSAVFSADDPGAYRVRVRGTSGAGWTAEAIHVFTAASTAPSVLVSASVTNLGGSQTINAAIGNLVALNAIIVGNTATTVSEWTLANKPAGSQATLSVALSTFANFVPDVLGSYTVQFRVRDVTQALTSLYSVQVVVAPAPLAVLNVSVLPVAAGTAPSYVAATGTPVTLRGTGSYDPAGGALGYAWSLLARPFGSAAALTAPAAAVTDFTPDVVGSYVIELMVTASNGSSARQRVTVNTAAMPPQGVVNRSRLAVLLGGSVTASAAASISPSGNPLAFHWAIDSRPPGSSAAVANPASATLEFTPDVAGTYGASVTVSDGPLSTVVPVVITALTGSAGTVPLAYAPLHTRFSKALGKVVIVSANPNALHIVDAIAVTDVSVALPATVKSLQISPNGLLAAVLHEGAVSLIDLTTATLTRSSSAGGSPTDAFVNNAGLIWMVGRSGGQSVSPAYTVINGITGDVVQLFDLVSIYGTTRGVYSERMQTIFTLSEGLSPADIKTAKVDATTGLLVSGGEAPYHGDYGMGNPLWLSSDETLLFTGAGPYFRTSDLRYAGTLGAIMTSVSHSASAAEVLALPTNTFFPVPGIPPRYSSVLKRYTGALLFPADDLPLPILFGAQTYGIAVFHMADDRRVLVVQAGSDVSLADGLSYFVIVR